jgi:hypothetical protein
MATILSVSGFGFTVVLAKFTIVPVLTHMWDFFIIRKWSCILFKVAHTQIQQIKMNEADKASLQNVVKAQHTQIQYRLNKSSNREI